MEDLLVKLGQMGLTVNIYHDGDKFNAYTHVLPDSDEPIFRVVGDYDNTVKEISDWTDKWLSLRNTCFFSGIIFDINRKRVFICDPNTDSELTLDPMYFDAEKVRKFIMECTELRESKSINLDDEVSW